MAELLKEMFFTEDSLNKFADSIKKVYKDFDKKKFLSLVMDKDQGKRELKEKMYHTTECLKKTFPPDYKENLDLLIKAAPSIKGFEAMCLPDFAEKYGIDEPDISLPALAVFTRYSSSEFGIRPFIIKYPEKAMELLNKCAESEYEMVRRLASEGSRPRLPWAIALPEFKKDPSLVLPLLEKLKDDESETVRRSVANNLNDISKDNPDVVLEIAERWYGKSKNRDRLIKHGLRTLLKAGNKRALLLFGFIDSDNVFIENLSVNKNRVKIGEILFFNFDLNIKEKKEKKIRLEYIVYFKKLKGKVNKKVFRITENTYKKGVLHFSKKHNFSDLSTRKHNRGEHKIAILINGVEKAVIQFNLFKYNKKYCKVLKNR